MRRLLLLCLPLFACVTTKHVFDTFAPESAAAHHVYAVTATLGEDVVRVLEGLGIAKASFEGHSTAGPELTWVTTHHPECVEKVICLDMNTDGNLLAELLTVLPMPLSSEPAPEDVASRAAVAAASEGHLGEAGDVLRPRGPGLMLACGEVEHGRAHGRSWARR